jgi:tRNA(Arg) A34 adenosine deaminase TadA
VPDRAKDEAFLRRAITLSRSAVAHGNHPFGALLVDAQGQVLLESENSVGTTRDATAHAERSLVAQASMTCTPETLSGATLYSSAEPCAMCAGAIYWAGIGRVVFGLGEARLKSITGNHPENPTLDMPCRNVFATGQRDIAVEGPMLEDEAAAPHEDFWRARG